MEPTTDYTHSVRYPNHVAYPRLRMGVRAGVLPEVVMLTGEK